MRKLLFAVACFGLLVLPVMAQNVPPQYLNVTNTDGSLESGWVVGFPTGSSDYFNSRHDGLSGLAIAGASVGSADFGSGTAYPRVGLYDANFTVDATGNTPDLATGTEANNVPGGGAVYNYVYGSFGGNYFPAVEPQHVAAQLPPGDSGLLGIGNDDTSTTLFAGWTLDGYASVSNGGYNFGLNAIVDEIKVLQNLPGSMNSGFYEYLNNADEMGDFTTVTVAAGQFYGVYYVSSRSGVRWQLWLSFLGAPIKKVGPTLFAFPFGGGSFIRAGDFFPVGFGGFTFNFVAIGGIPGVKGTVDISNEVTLITLPDPSCNWGTKDDGTYEGGWVVSIPAGSSDYFNTWYNCLLTPPITTVTDYKLAVMDFGSLATQYPTSGVFGPNYTVDASGWTPDLGNGFGVQPFTYVPLTFVSTSGLLVTNDFVDFPYSTFGTDDVHGVIQFPAGDSGLLGIGGDTTPTPSISWGTGWTVDGFTTPTNRFDGTAGWGMRLGSF
jgi:hypothetical protein